MKTVDIQDRFIKKWIARFRASVFRYSVKTWVNILVLKLSGRDIVKTGKCNYCGACCRNINLQLCGKWLRKEHEFYQLIKELPQYKRFYITGVDRQGFLQFNCSFQDKDGSCSDYQDRLDICKSFPDKSLVLCGGIVPENCGYSLQVGISFSKRLLKAQKKYEK